MNALGANAYLRYSLPDPTGANPGQRPFLRNVHQAMNWTSWPGGIDEMLRAANFELWDTVTFYSSKEKKPSVLIVDFRVFDPRPMTGVEIVGVCLGGAADPGQLSRIRTIATASPSNPSRNMPGTYMGFTNRNAFGGNAFYMGVPGPLPATLNVVMGIGYAYSLGTGSIETAFMDAHMMASVTALNDRPDWNWHGDPAAGDRPLMCINSGVFMGSDFNGSPAVVAWVLMTDKIERIMGVPWDLIK